MFGRSQMYLCHRRRYRTEKLSLKQVFASKIRSLRLFMPPLIPQNGYYDEVEMSEDNIFFETKVYDA